MSVEDDDGVISRWSKRKRGIALEAEAEEIVLSPEEQLEVDEALDAELLANREAAEEIDLDTIDGESDLSIFMKEGVPEALKKQALAVLWRSNPVFANIDGLNDYDDDFANPDLIMKTFKSAWQAGRGYLKKEPEPVEEEDETSVASVDERQVEEAEKALENEAESDVVEDEIQDDFNNEAKEEMLADTEAEQAFEDEPMPKVSLRQRLILDS